MALIESFSTSTGVNFNLIADCYLDEQNTSTNKSKVTVKLYLEHNKISATALSGSYLSVAGNKVSYDGTKITQPGYGITKKLLATKTVTISHSSDGKGSCNVKGVFVLNGTYGGKYITTLTLNETLTLPTIPRSSTFSMASSINTGSSLKITITPSSSSFKHKVRFEIDGTSKYTSDWIAAGTTSKSFDIPHSWVTDDVSKTMTVYCYTYTSSATSGSDYIARISKTVTLNVPDSVVPTISKFESTVVNGLSGKYVEGKSSIKLSVTASGKEGATIKSYVYSGPNINGSKSSYTSTSSSKTSSIIQKSGEISYSIYVKDSRGRKSAKKTITINVEPYFEPTITSLTVQRCTSDGTISSSGTYAYVTVTSNYAKVGGANTRTVVLSNSSDNYAASKTIQSTSNTNNTYSGVYGSGFALGTEYTIRAKITDTAYSNTDEDSVKLTTAERPLNIAKYGNGVAIGGMSTVTSSTESGKFECNWPSYLNQSAIMTAPSTDSYRYEVRRMQSDNSYIRGQLYIGDGGAATTRELHYNSTSKTYNEGAGLRLYKDFASLEIGETNMFRVFKDNATYGTCARIYEPLTVNDNVISDKDFLTNGKTGAYDGKQGACVSANGRVYVVGNSSDTSTGNPGLVFAFNKATSNTSYIIETASGVLTVKGTLKATVDSSSDERLKKDFGSLDKFEGFYDDLQPCCFKMKSDDERYHIGFKAQQIEQSLQNNGLTKDDFGALNITPYEGDIDETSTDCVGRYKNTGIKKGEDSYDLAYTEFIALNTHMIQKLQKIVQDQQNEIEALKAEINDMKNK